MIQKFRKKLLQQLFIFALLCFSGICVDGVDFGVVEGVLNIEQFKCLIDQGKEFIVMQLWRSNGLLNPYFTINYETSMALGITDISAYAFICNQINTPDQICPGVVAALPVGFKGRVYIDVEPEDNCWVGNTTERLQFVEAVATTCMQHGLDVGVYSSHRAWNGVFGSDNVTSPILTQLPLWYNHFDHNDSFTGDYATQSFGGWTSAVIKQYAPLQLICGATFDLNVY